MASGEAGQARKPSFTAEVEAPPQSPRGYFNDPQASRFFPFEAFKCCPLWVKAVIPKTWQKIQDLTHLILVSGAIASTALVVRTIIMLSDSSRGLFCFIKELVGLAFIVPCISYIVRIIGQYDDRLASKQKDAKEQKANLARSYNDLLTDMDGLLTKSAESSAGLAERSFESKRRDFQRFLERAKNKYNVYSGTQGDSDKLLMQFRRFCKNWLNVFEECSIDPINCPKRVVTEEELNRCTSIVDVTDLCLERLRVTEVRFISIQRDQDAQMLRKNRNEFRRLSLAPPTPAREEAEPQKLVSWLTLGRGHGFRVNSNSQSEDNFPKECSFGCGRLVVLSSEHLMLLTGFLIGWSVILLEIYYVATEGSESGITAVSFVDLVALVIAEICVMTMLLKFEELDIIQQLEREVKELAKQNEQVEKQRERMREFWSNAQQLTELWLYRTVPRLDLYKELHSLLEDTEEDLLMKISSANQQLEDLDSSLGALQAWRCDGALTIEAKKGFGKAINQLCQEQEFDGILVKLEEVTANGQKTLQALK